MESVPVTMGTGRLNAGPFSAWLDATQAGFESPIDADVACGACIGCCASSQFVFVEAHETDALAHIPAELLFDAPTSTGGQRGTMLMGYDEYGRCPMLTDAGCSIYEHRPQTCRTYDCRVFEAAGVTADQPLVRERSERWRFEISDAAEQERLDAVRAAATRLGEMPALRRAVLAVRSAD